MSHSTRAWQQLMKHWSFTKVVWHGNSTLISKGTLLNEILCVIWLNFRIYGHKNYICQKRYYIWPEIQRSASLNSSCHVVLYFFSSFQLANVFDIRYIWDSKINGKKCHHKFWKRNWKMVKNLFFIEGKYLPPNGNIKKMLSYSTVHTNKMVDIIFRNKLTKNPKIYD